jgi:hypothetical protein
MSLGGANTSSAPEHPRVTVDARRCMHDQSRGSSEGLSRPRRRRLNERRRVGAKRPADRARQQRILDTCGCPPARPAVLASSRSTTGARPVPFEPELFRRGGSDRGCGPFVNGERTHLVAGWAEGDDLEACRVAYVRVRRSLSPVDCRRRLMPRAGFRNPGALGIRTRRPGHARLASSPRDKPGASLARRDTHGSAARPRRAGLVLLARRRRDRCRDRP